MMTGNNPLLLGVAGRRGALWSSSGGKEAIFGPLLGIFALRDHWEQVSVRMF